VSKKQNNDSFNTSITPISNFKNNKKSLNSDEKRGVERFRRVKDETVEIDDRLADNSFDAKVSVHDLIFEKKIIKRKKKRRAN
jgi:hypothetical protein